MRSACVGVRAKRWSRAHTWSEQVTKVAVRLLVPDTYSDALRMRELLLTLSVAAIVMSSCAPTEPPVSGGGRRESRTAASICLGKRATVSGTAGDDRLEGTSQPDVIAAQGGNDTVLALSGNDRVCGGSGRDRLKGSTGADRLSGGPANDYLSGARGSDVLSGGKAGDRGPVNDPHSWGSTGALGGTSSMGGREGTTSTASATTIAFSDKRAMTC